METLLIDSQTRPESILAFMGVDRLLVVKQGSAALLTPNVIDPTDYENDTDYLCAIPGMKESLIELRNAPESEFEDVPDDWIDRNV